MFAGRYADGLQRMTRSHTFPCDAGLWWRSHVQRVGFRQEGSGGAGSDGGCVVRRLMPASTPAIGARAAPTFNGRSGILGHREVPTPADTGVRVRIVMRTGRGRQPNALESFPLGSIWGRSGERAHSPRSAPSC
jgi:hypothetical protein